MTETRLPIAETERTVDRMIAATPIAPLAPELVRKINGELAASLQPVKTLPATRTLAVQFASVFLVFATGLIALMGVAGLGSLELWQAIGILAILLVGVLLLTIVLAWQIRPASRERIPAKVSWVCFGLGFLTAAAVLFPWLGTEAYVSQGWPCLLTGTAVAIPGGLLFWLLARRGVPLSPVTFGGTLGAIAGLLGVTVLQFRCIHQEASHLVLWHGGVLLISTVAGILIALAIDRVRVQ